MVGITTVNGFPSLMSERFSLLKLRVLNLCYFGGVPVKKKAAGNVLP